MTSDNDDTNRAHDDIAEMLQEYLNSRLAPTAWRGLRLYSFDISFGRLDGPSIETPTRIAAVTADGERFMDAVRKDAEFAVLPMAGRGH